MAYAKDIKCKLYLEGLEIPFNSVTIMEQVGQPVQATFSVAPHSKMPFLLPKTLAHLFYFVDEDYRLIFEGELANIGMNKDTQSRHITLTFISATSNWYHTYISPVNFTVQNVQERSMYLMPGKYDGKATTNNTTEKQFADYTKNLPDEEIVASRKKDTWYFTKELQYFNLLNALKTTLEDKLTLSATLLSLLEHINKLNGYYPIVNNSLKLNKRALILENSKAEKLIQDEYLVQMLLQEVESLSSTTNFMQALSVILTYLMYDWTEIAAPIKHPNAVHPVSTIIFKPKTDYLMPLRSNIIYPDQISNLDYQRNFLTEPTRMFFEPITLLAKASPTADVHCLLFHYSPSIEVQKKDGLPIFSLTSEEKYRGMQIHQGSPPSLADRTYANLFNKDNEISPQPYIDMEKVFTDEETKKPVDFISNTLDRQFITERFNSRSVSISTNYTPYRLVGFPAVVLDEIFPSIVGNISSITSTISADGQGTQTISIEHPRIFLNDNDISSTMPAGIDTVPMFPGYFDDSYKAKNIGKQRYSQLINRNNQTSADESIWTYVTDEEAKTIDDIATDPEHEAEYEAQRLSLAIKKLKRAYKSIQFDKHIYINNQIKRSLVTEKEWWTFLNVHIENGIPRPSAVESTFVSKTIDISGAAADADKPGSINRPFVRERRNRVKEIIQK